VNVPAIDVDGLWETLLELLRIPSPTGYTDRIVHRMVELLSPLDAEVRVTRRGAIRARLKGEAPAPARAILSHLDTTGAMVRSLKANGRLAVVPVGTWSSRFAEGSRVTVFAESGPIRGTVLPLKASGHAFDREVDEQPVGWDHVEVRVDVPAAGRADLEREGLAVGCFVAVDPATEVTENGYVVSRHLDDKAGVAAVLGAARAATSAGRPLPVDCNLLFTISEEVGTGASAVLHGDVAEIVAVDNAVPAPGQESIEDGVTVAMADSTGPFDFHLTRRLLDLCAAQGLRHVRDVFRHYRCDAASAVEAGNDLRTALIGVGVDASHGNERTHIGSIVETARLLAAYMLAPAMFARDREAIAPLGSFPSQPTPGSPAEPVLPQDMPGRQGGDEGSA
jgi:peptidase M42 family hydrolase